VGILRQNYMASLPSPCNASLLCPYNTSDLDQGVASGISISAGVATTQYLSNDKRTEWTLNSKVLHFNQVLIINP